MPRLSVHSRTCAHPSPLSSTLKDGERSGHRSARRGPNSVSASQTAAGSRSVSTEYETLATELLLRKLPVDCLVRKRVGAAVFFTFDMRHLHLGKLTNQIARLLMQRDELRSLDPVPAVHLLHDQLGVEIDLESVGLPRLRRLEALDERVVLGLVIGGHAEPAMKALHPHAVLILDHDPHSSRPGIAARRAVG